MENKPCVLKERQKKRIREDKFEKAMDLIIEKVTKAQKESNEMFMKHEEKRMKLDERMMEMDDHRLREDKEREERQRTKEHEFQYRILMLQQYVYMGSQLPSFPLGFNYSQDSSLNCSREFYVCTARSKKSLFLLLLLLLLSSVDLAR